MTTPRDDIAGLNERLREDIAQLVTAISQAKFSGPRTEIRVKDPSALMDDLTDAAAQLDSLLKERDALQARVKELEERVHYAEGTADFAMKHRDRAEQERDTLARVMEDTANELGCEPNNEVILETILRLQQERDEAYERLTNIDRIVHTPTAGKETATHHFQRDFDAIRAMTRSYRRLAGPEKEG